MPYRVLQYQIKAEPVPLGAKETITPDKWLSGVPDNPVRRLPISVALISSLAFVPVISAAAATPVYVNSQSCEPIAIQTFQYQAKAEPVFIPTAEAETITLDRWNPAWPQPYPRRRRLVQYEKTFAIAGQVDDGLPPIWWMPEVNRPPARSKLRRLDTNGSMVFVVTVPAEVVTPDKYLSHWPQPYPRRKHPVIQGERQVQITVFGETVRLDKWLQETQRPRFDLKRNQRLYPSFSADTQLYVVPGAEVISLDKWLSYQPTQFPKRKSIAGEFSFYVIPVVTIPPSSEPALWVNTATISLIAADLQSVGILPEEVKSISVMTVNLGENSLLTENSALVSVTTKDDRSISILYEDVRTI